MKVTSDEWRVASDTQQRGEAIVPPWTRGTSGGFLRASCSSVHRALPLTPNPSPALGRGEPILFGQRRAVDPSFSPLATRHSPLANPGLNLLAEDFASALAEISVYPPTIQLQGPKATQVLLVNSGQRDITGECSFRIANPAVASVSEAGVVTATADGKTTLTVVCKEGQVKCQFRLPRLARHPNSVS